MYHETVLPVLVEDGFLVLSEANLRCTKPTEKLPKSIQDIWLPVLDQFNRTWNGFYVDLLEYILDTILEESPMMLVTSGRNHEYCCTLTSWALFILERLKIAGYTDLDDLLEKFSKSTNL
jgi:hypothetical protein